MQDQSQLFLIISQTETTKCWYWERDALIIYTVCFSNNAVLVIYSDCHKNHKIKTFWSFPVFWEKLTISIKQGVTTAAVLHMITGTLCRQPVSRFWSFLKLFLRLNISLRANNHIISATPSLEIVTYLDSPLLLCRKI